MIRARATVPILRPLGDSVYVEVERGMLKLTTDNGLGLSNTIYHEAEVYAALVAYVADVTRAARPSPEPDTGETA